MADEKKEEKHEHVWQSAVRGDGSAAVHVTECSICGEEKAPDKE